MTCAGNPSNHENHFNLNLTTLVAHWPGGKKHFPSYFTAFVDCSAEKYASSGPNSDFYLKRDNLII
jgi:hypothetical protein